MNYAVRTVEEACTRDLSSRLGAEHLAKCLRTYWATQGVIIQTSIEAVGHSSGEVVYGVKTKGIPLSKGR